MNNLPQPFLSSQLMGANWDNNSHDRQTLIFKYRRWLIDFQNELKKEPQVEIKVYHKFIGDYYLRTAILPAGYIVVGKTHTMPMVDVVLYGDHTVMIDGCHIRMKDGDRFMSQAGSKKAGYSHKETAFTNIYWTKSRDIKEIEADTLLTEEEEEDYINTELKYLGVT